MKALVFWLSLAFIMIAGHSACSQGKKKGSYKLWVKLMESEEVIQGKLLELKDTVIVFRVWESERIEELPVSEVKTIKFRRNRAIGKGAAIGAGAGLVLGAIIGFADGDDPPGFWSSTAEEKSVGSAVLLAAVGAPVGAVVGSLKKNFQIEGRQDLYQQWKPEMSRYLPNP